jgi:hypothetical protein
MIVRRAILLAVIVASFTSVFAQTPDPHAVPVMDGGAGKCSVAFTVTDGKGAPVYAAQISVHIAYGFASVRKLDLQVSTNVDGKAQFKGLPEKVKDKTLMFRATEGNRDGSAIYDPVANCAGQQSSIVLTLR